MFSAVLYDIDEPDQLVDKPHSKSPWLPSLWSQCAPSLWSCAGDASSFTSSFRAKPIWLGLAPQYILWDWQTRLGNGSVLPNKGLRLHDSHSKAQQRILSAGHILEAPQQAAQQCGSQQHDGDLGLQGRWVIQHQGGGHSQYRALPAAHRSCAQDTQHQWQKWQRRQQHVKNKGVLSRHARHHALGWARRGGDQGGICSAQEALGQESEAAREPVGNGAARGQESEAA